MKKSLIVLVVIVAIAAGAFVLTRDNDSDNNTNTDTSSNNQTQNTTPSASNDQSTAATITYSDDGFSPSTITVKAGTTVTVKNTSSDELQYDSDPHPTHTDNEELNVGAIDPGKSGTFTPNTKGTFGYHNHLSPSHKGTITVE